MELEYYVELEKYLNIQIYFYIYGIAVCGSARDKWYISLLTTKRDVRIINSSFYQYLH